MLYLNQKENNMNRKYIFKNVFIKLKSTKIKKLKGKNYSYCYIINKYKGIKII